MINKYGMNKFLVNEPLMLAGKHRTQGETTELLQEDEQISNLCKTGAIMCLGSVVPASKSIFSELARLDKGVEVARGNSKLDTHSNKKKKTNR